jgi:hypothetical protein
VAGVIGAILGIFVAVIFMAIGEVLRRRRTKKTLYNRGGGAAASGREGSYMGDSVSRGITLVLIVGC